MYSSYKFSFSKVLVSALFFLIVLCIIATISENALFLQFTKPLFIPVFLIFFFTENRRISILLFLFILYSFFGDLSSVFFSNDTFIKASSIMYLLSYLSLVAFVAPKFDYSSVSKLVATYLVIVVLINLYFLYTIYSILITIIPDSLEVFLFGAKSMSLILLLFMSLGVYLNAESNLSIFFLLMAICFAFSDVLNYINQYYVYHWSFSMIDRVLHATGIFFLFNYIVVYNKTRISTAVISSNKISEENVLA